MNDAHPSDPHNTDPMDTATTELTHAHGDSARDVPAQDPDHDIDVKKTVTALVLSAVFVFVCVGVLHVVFSRVIFQARQQKVDRAPTTQLDQLRADENAALSTNGGMDKAIQDYINKHR